MERAGKNKVYLGEGICSECGKVSTLLVFHNEAQGATEGLCRECLRSLADQERLPKKEDLPVKLYRWVS